VHLEKVIVPVLLEPNVSVPISLKRLQHADFTQGITVLEFAKLMRALNDMQKIPVAESPPIPVDPKGIPSRAWQNFKPTWTDVFTAPVHEPQNEYEELIERVEAARVWTPPTTESHKSAFSRMVSKWRELILLDGLLILTNQRLLFEIVNFRITPRISPRINAFLSTPLAIPLSAIESVALSFPYRIKIRCHSGEEYKFAIDDRDRIVAKIAGCRKQFDRSVAR
jgi:hypothetical protein